MIQLLDFQKPYLPEILRQIREENFSLNASDTGTGKTYLTLAALQELGKPYLVVAPRGLHSMWKEVSELIETPMIDVVSVEKLRYGNSPYVTKLPPATPSGKPRFRWHMDDPEAIIVFEEVHCCNGAESQNAFIFGYTKALPNPVMGLSATAADSPAKLRAIGYHANLHDFVGFRTWAIKQGCFIDQHNQIRYAPHSLAVERLKEIHKQMFPRYGVRMKIAEIKDFPENQVFVQKVDNTTPASWDKDFREKYPEIYDWESPPTTEEHKHLSDMFGGGGADDKEFISEQVIYLRKRQQAELNKVHFLVNHIPELLEEGLSVPVFLNFLAPVHELRERLNIPSVLITGPTPQDERTEAEKQFQANKVHVLIATPGAGGVGRNMHDLNGRPRHSLISPGFNSVEFKQVMGRIHRAGSLSPARQAIICLSKSLENKVYSSLKRKIHQLHLIQDGDLAPELS